MNRMKQMQTRMKQMQTIATALQNVKHPEKRELLMFIATRDKNLQKKIGENITDITIMDNWTVMKVQFATGDVVISI